MLKKLFLTTAITIFLINITISPSVESIKPIKLSINNYQYNIKDLISQINESMVYYYLKNLCSVIRV